MAKWPYGTSTWKQLRKQKLEAEPFCEVCHKRGKQVIACTVDHIVSIAAGGAPFPSLAGLMSMCISCHSVKTNAVDNPFAFGSGVKQRYKGCAADGAPIDPLDPWHGGASKDGERALGNRRGQSGTELISDDEENGAVLWV